MARKPELARFWKTGGRWFKRSRGKTRRIKASGAPVKGQLYRTKSGQLRVKGKRGRRAEADLPELFVKEKRRREVAKVEAKKSGVLIKQTRTDIRINAAIKRAVQEGTKSRTTRIARPSVTYRMKLELWFVEEIGYPDLARGLRRLQEISEPPQEEVALFQIIYTDEQTGIEFGGATISHRDPWVIAVGEAEQTITDDYQVRYQNTVVNALFVYWGSPPPTTTRRRTP